MAEPILSLEAILPESRPYLTINGEVYYFRHPQQMGLLEQAKILRMGRAWTEVLPRIGEASDEELAEAAENVHRLVLSLVEGIEPILGSLSFGQQVQIVAAYPQVRSGFGLPAAANGEAPSMSDTSSPASPASTEPMTG